MTVKELIHKLDDLPLKKQNLQIVVFDGDGGQWIPITEILTKGCKVGYSEEKGVGLH